MATEWSKIDVQLFLRDGVHPHLVIVGFYTLPVRLKSNYERIINDYCKASWSRSEKWQREVFSYIQASRYGFPKARYPLFNWDRTLKDVSDFCCRMVANQESWTVLRDVEQQWVLFAAGKLQPISMRMDVDYGDMIRRDQENLHCCKVHGVEGKMNLLDLFKKADQYCYPSFRSVDVCTDEAEVKRLIGVS